ncbi:hypothetical protein STAL104432_17095 [Streptomyces albus]
MWARSAAACPRTASGEAPDSSSGRGRGGAAAAPGDGDGSGPASSRITCALVPPIPNADTPARRGRPVRGHGLASVSSRTVPADQSTSGDGVSACRVRGIVPCRSASTILITPAVPDADWVCPMFDLSAPSHKGSPPARSAP